MKVVIANNEASAEEVEDCNENEEGDDMCLIQ